MMAKSIVGNSLLESVPKHNYLHLLEGNTAKNVVEFLALSRNDVSKAMGIEQDSVRFDKYMPKELEMGLNEIANICELMAKYFEGDVKKQLCGLL